VLCVAGVPQGGPRWGGGPGGGGEGAGRGGGAGSEGGAERLHDAHLQQQIVLVLRRLREDMSSVMERLEAVERLAATQVSPPGRREPLLRFTFIQRRQEVTMTRSSPGALNVKMLKTCCTNAALAGDYSQTHFSKTVLKKV